MEILFISCDTGLLDKTDSGAAQRSTLFVNALSGIGHVDVISFYKEKVSSNIEGCDVIYNLNIENPARKSGFDFPGFLFEPGNPYSYFDLNKEREKVIDEQIAKKNYDIIACRYISNAIKCGLLKYSSRLVIDADDNIVSAIRRDHLYAPAKKLHKRILRWFKPYCAGIMAKRLLSKVKCSFYSNKLEPPYKDSIYLHNTTTTQSEMPVISPDTPLRLLTVGWMSFTPNFLGVKHFVECVLPLVREKFPDVELLVAGKFDDEQKKRELEQYSNVKVLGFVPDLVAEYKDSRIVVVPLYHGAGTSVKFIEGAAMKRPVVSSIMGARGLDYAFESNIDYFLAEDDQDFANKIIALLSSTELSNEMADKAARKVSEHFSREQFYDIVSRAILDA